MDPQAPQYSSIPQMVLAAAERYGDDAAVIDGDHHATFKGVRAGMLEVAGALAATGVEPGDRVALWAPNSLEWILAALGILAAGAWLVPLNTRFKGEEAAYIVDKVRARLVFVAPASGGTDYYGMLRSAAPDLVARSQVVEVGATDGRDAGAGQVAWRDFLERAGDVPPSTVPDRIAGIGPDDTSDIIFTSGTTGLPKGVLLRHGASLAAFAAYNRGYGIAAQDRALIALPFSHTFGYKAGWMLDLMCGATTVPVAFFDPALVLQTIAAHRITHMPGPPTMFHALLDHPARSSSDLSSLRGITVAASTVPVQLIYRLMEELSLETCLAGYGLTETHGLVSTTLPGDRAELVAHTVGRPIPGVEVRVMDDQDHDVADGLPGELWVRGYTTMTGYFGDPEATDAVLADGWLRTGDIVKIDEEGYLRITDRKKDLFIVGGFNVAPAEVERCLSGCDQVAQVAVIGVPDDYYGEVGMAFVIAPADSDPSEEEIVAYARAHLANYKVPRRVVFVHSFPLNATGKVLKNELRALAAQLGPSAE